MTVKIIAMLICSATLFACSGIPYRIDIEQGNIVDRQVLGGLRVGMHKNQVRQVLGNALLADMFHKNRWDYVQYYKDGRTQSIQEGKVSLYFTNDLLSRIEADELIEIQSKNVNYDTRSKNNIDDFID